MAEESNPVPTARDTELFDLVSVALKVVPADSVSVTMGWRPQPHWWEVRIRPVRSAAAAVTIGNEIGMDSFNIMVAKTWLELDYPTDRDVLQQIVQAVALRGFEGRASGTRTEGSLCATGERSPLGGPTCPGPGKPDL